MIVEIVEAGMIVAAGALGNVMGWTRGRAERNIINLFTTGQAENLWCLCGHAMSMHAKGTDSCNDHALNDQGKMIVTYKTGVTTQYMRCPCMKFVGDPSRNPTPVQTRKDVLDLGQ